MSKKETAGKPRETMPAPTSAGFQDAQDRARTSQELPFDPAEIKVRTLEESLAEIDDVEMLHRLQRIDRRPTAAAHYERRINELEDPAAAGEEA